MKLRGWLPSDPAVGVRKLVVVAASLCPNKTKFLGMGEVQLSEVFRTKELPFQYRASRVIDASP
jgi:hypothetical protein